jgi:hypothetical protein
MESSSSFDLPSVGRWNTWVQVATYGMSSYHMSRKALEPQRRLNYFKCSWVKDVYAPWNMANGANANIYLEISSVGRIGIMECKVLESTTLELWHVARLPYQFSLISVQPVSSSEIRTDAYRLWKIRLS